MLAPTGCTRKTAQATEDLLMKTRLLAATATLAAALLLGACSKPPAPKAAANASAAASTAKHHVTTPFDPLLKDEDKARGVQKTILDSAAKQRKAIDDAGG